MELGHNKASHGPCRHTVMCRLTMVMHSEKCTVRQFLHYANIIECTYTNLASTVQPTTYLGYMV